MCLAIYKPEKVRLVKSEMQKAFTINPDGAGFAYYDPMFRRVVINKGFWKFRDFWEAFNPIQMSQLKAIVHFRLATHGDVSWDNCHPYELADGALIHNGIIDATASWSRLHSLSKEEYMPSDTLDFVNYFLKGMRETQMRKSARLIEHAIGDWSKVVTLHDSGRHLIFNEDAGWWDRGAWYSNRCYALGTSKGGVS